MLKVGVFGVGHLGKFHLNNWAEIYGAHVIGFFDPEDSNANEVTEKYGVKRYTDGNKLIQACDIVDVVVPTDKHYEVCKHALRRGKHVFVEKPLAKTLEEAKELIELAKEANVKVQVGHVERFNPALLALKGVQLNPMFIEVHRLSQFNPRGTEVSVVLDLMIHDIDIVLSLVKSTVKSIHASGVSVMTDTPDIASVRLEFNNGCVANITSSRISLKKMRKMRIFQKDAYISVDFLEKKTEIIKLQEEGDSLPGLSFDLETSAGTKKISISSPTISESNAIKLELESFLDSIVNDKPTVVSEIDGFMAMEVAHKIIEKINRSNNLT